MGRGGGNPVFFFLLAWVLLLFALQMTTPASAEKKSFVVFFRKFPASPSALLTTITNDFEVLYKLRAIRGIALHIDQGFVTRLRQMAGVVAVIPDTLIQLHTTHSWDFLGLASNGGHITSAWSSANLGADTIIGCIDTGVWPESLSFQNETMTKPPSDWHGNCDKGSDPTFECNRKLIGARFFSKAIRTLSGSGGGGDGGRRASEADLSSPRDYVGHGTHVLSTAGGSFVQGASVLGHGKGTAAGGSPSARLASYKACYKAVGGGCSATDVLAAIVAAVADGVHVLSLSLGGGGPASDYLDDLIAIGALHAVQRGVTVVCSAGNGGPKPGTVTNVAPWIFTVGASTTDRDFPSYVDFLGSGIEGQGLTDSTLPIGQSHPIVSGSSVYCTSGSLDPAEVKGKIVVCYVEPGQDTGRDTVEKGLVVKQAGGVGMVLCNDPRDWQVTADAHVLPAAHCSANDCVGLFDYLESTNDTFGYIDATTEARFGVTPAPKTAGFSSRGPSAITPQILKPDITAPGVNVIAAYSGAASPTGRSFDDRRVPYNSLSGTSMSCAHVAGIVGLLKTRHPSWSPAMIESAIMTTAYTTANDGNPIRDEAGGNWFTLATPFHYGSGHVDPVKALDPGLVYDTTPIDYTAFLCSLPAPTIRLPLLLNSTGKKPCAVSKKGLLRRPEDLNYPSIAVSCLSASGNTTTTVKRRLKNVGPPGKYKVTVTEPAGVKVTVVPNELEFRVGEEKVFIVKLDVVNGGTMATKPTNDYVFGSIVWSDMNEEHHVRSPVAVKTTKCS